MRGLTAVTVSLNYGDFLRHTLPVNRHHFDRMVVVTSSADEETIQVAQDCDVVLTDFGPKFSKYAGIELGLQGVEGWIMLLDADVMLPREIGSFAEGHLYSPFRRMCNEYPPPPESDWCRFPRGNNKPWQYLGYCQVFHSSDPVLGSRPWHGSYPTAAVGDMMFMQRWPREKRVRPVWDVLHLGEPRRNWNGRVTRRYE